jgi:hypothetical protein
MMKAKKEKPSSATSAAEGSVIKYQEYLLRRQSELLREAHRRDVQLTRRMKQLKRENVRLKKISRLDFIHGIITSMISSKAEGIK